MFIFFLLCTASGAIFGYLRPVSVFVMAATKTRNLMTEEELIELEKQEFETGPLSVLLNAVKNNTQARSFTLLDIDLVVVSTHFAA